jgi:hypothetical protein
VRERFGDFDREIADGLSVRHEPGSAYMSDDFQAELAFLGMTGSPSFVREPEFFGTDEHPRAMSRISGLSQLNLRADRSGLVAAEG